MSVYKFCPESIHPFNYFISMKKNPNSPLYSKYTVLWPHGLKLSTVSSLRTIIICSSYSDGDCSSGKSQRLQGIKTGLSRGWSYVIFLPKSSCISIYSFTLCKWVSIIRAQVRSVISHYQLQDTMGECLFILVQ